MTELAMKVVPRTDGVLHPVLMRGGVPLVLPNLWVDDLSLTARFNTLKSYLRDVQDLYRWSETAGVNIHEAFADLRGLSPAALKSATAYMSTKRNGGLASQSSCARKAQALRSFFSFSFDYFMAKEALGLLEQRQCERNRAALLAKVDKYLVMRGRLGEVTRHTEGLQEDQVAALETALNPASDINPFVSMGLRVRNYCIWRTMLATGARRSEIVLLELDDLELGSRPTITIRRPLLASANRRRDGASLKTQQRTLPIRRGLAELLETYIEDWRVDQVRPRHPSAALFLSTRDGRRLFSTSVNHVLSRASTAAISAGLFQRVHPHCLRTTAMNALSRKARDGSGRLDASFRDQLTYFAGWSPRSEMPLTYTREALSEALGMLLRKPRTHL